MTPTGSGFAAFCWRLSGQFDQRARMWQRLIELSDDPVLARKIHGWATLFWIAMAVPSALTGLKNSITYLVFLSVYAAITGHWSGYQAAGAECKVEEAAEEAREAADGD